MNPRDITDTDLGYWADLNPTRHVFTAPGEIEAGVEPCAGIVTDDASGNQFGQVVRVPWVLNEIELTHLAKGGTLWLSTWGGLPMHMLEVQPPAGAQPPIDEVRAADVAAGGRQCRTCGCTDNAACSFGASRCWWVEPDLCSTCATRPWAQP